MLPVIFGLSGPILTADERAFFADAQPAGYILFKRNIVDRTQLRALTDSLRALHGRDDLAILIDQEGGKVARMRPPEWPDFPAGPAFGALYDLAPSSAIEAMRCNAEAIALTLSEVGITVDCLPLLDVRTADTHPAIAERALGGDPMRVAALGRATLDGLARGGVVGVVKHMPGQGRALVDSHLELPKVRASTDALQTDLEPFRTLNTAPMGMTAHVIFTEWDAHRTATMSPPVIERIIRGAIGFDGFLMSDDLDMQALSGSVPDRAVCCVAAGCDVALNCWGRFDEMVAIAQALPPIRPQARARLDRAMASASAPGDLERLADLIATRDTLLALR